MLATPRPSLLRLIQTDYPSFLAALFPLFGWGFFLVDRLRRVDTDANFVLIMGALTLAAVLVLVWRYTSIASIYAAGQEVTATLNNAAFFRGRGNLTYIYKFQGGKYSCTNTVMKTNRTSAYAAGDRVTVLVDPNNPRRAVIKELYI